MSDRELLELAAKAAQQERSAAGDIWSNARGRLWNPLTDDGDALRLAVKLSIATYPPEEKSMSATANPPGHDAPWITEPVGSGDPYAATRRAIVRAAAEIGRNMQ